MPKDTTFSPAGRALSTLNSEIIIPLMCVCLCHPILPETLPTRPTCVPAPLFPHALWFHPGHRVALLCWAWVVHTRAGFPDIPRLRVLAAKEKNAPRGHTGT